MSEQQNFAPSDADWLAAEQLLDKAFEQKKRRRAFGFWLFAGCAAAGFLAFWLLKSEAAEAVLASSSSRQKADSSIEKMPDQNYFRSKDSLERMRVFQFRDSLLVSSDRKNEAGKATEKLESTDQSTTVFDINKVEKTASKSAEKAAASSQNFARKVVGEKANYGEKTGFSTSFLDEKSAPKSIEKAVASSPNAVEKIVGEDANNGQKAAEKGQVLDSKMVFALEPLPPLPMRFLPELARKATIPTFFAPFSQAVAASKPEKKRFKNQFGLIGGHAFGKDAFEQNDTLGHLRFSKIGLWHSHQFKGGIVATVAADYRWTNGASAFLPDDFFEGPSYRFGKEHFSQSMHYKNYRVLGLTAAVGYQFLPRWRVEFGQTIIRKLPAPMTYQNAAFLPFSFNASEGKGFATPKRQAKYVGLQCVNLQFNASRDLAFSAFAELNRSPFIDEIKTVRERQFDRQLFVGFEIQIALKSWKRL